MRRSLYWKIEKKTVDGRLVPRSPTPLRNSARRSGLPFLALRTARSCESPVHCVSTQGAARDRTVKGGAGDRPLAGRPDVRARASPRIFGAGAPLRLERVAGGVVTDVVRALAVSPRPLAAPSPVSVSETSPRRRIPAVPFGPRVGAFKETGV